MDWSRLRGQHVTVVEVGPRDGLQNEQLPVDTDAKVAFIDSLSVAGLPVIEVSAFVSPTRVPQMADAAEVFARIERRPGTRYTALVPNLHGLERAAAAGVREIAIFAAASEGFSRANIGLGVDASLAAYSKVCARAAEMDMKVRGYLSTAFGCPYDGAVAPATVASLSSRLFEMGMSEVAISDTIGVAHPGQVAAVLESVSAQVPLERVALHFHDTRGTALANVMMALTFGVSTFDASAGGLGGCPFAPGASGNLATEDLLYMLDGFGIESGISIEKVSSASRLIATRLGHALTSRYAAATRGPV
jgi:hydroxymethylglutaryl-CoA lyase